VDMHRSGHGMRDVGQVLMEGIEKKCGLHLLRKHPCC
jgi:hypothetical protein